MKPSFLLCSCLDMPIVDPAWHYQNFLGHGIKYFFNNSNLTAMEMKRKTHKSAFSKDDHHRPSMEQYSKSRSQ